MTRAKNQYSVPLNDYGYNLAFTVYESDQETVYALTGYTVTLKVWAPGDEATLIVDAECTVTDAAAGTCTYLVQDGDFAAIATYYGELELAKAGVVESTQPVWLLVRESA